MGRLSFPRAAEEEAAGWMSVTPVELLMMMMMLVRACKKDLEARTFFGFVLLREYDLLD